jgi:hypothetical protein
MTRSLTSIIILFLASAGVTPLVRWRVSAGERRHAAERESVLQRRVASIHLHGDCARQAFSKIEELAGVPICPRWGRHLAPDREVWLDLDDACVNDVMQAVTFQLRGYSAAAGYELQKNSIVVAPDVNLPRQMRIYDVRDLEQPARTPAPTSARARRAQPTELELASRLCLEPIFWQCGVVGRAEREWLSEAQGHLVIYQTEGFHEQFGRFLHGVRHARPDGTGPVMQRTCVFDRKTVFLETCFYDLRDLLDTAHYSAPALVIENATLRQPEELSGIAAFKAAIQLNIDPESWVGWCRGKAQPVCGRLAIEQTPQVQDRVRAMLADMRRGKWMTGFDLSLRRR